MQNEIHAFLKMNGCPTLFLTLNPSDIHYKLVYVLSGGDPALFHDLSAFKRARQVADNPAAAATFFDIIIKVFIQFILWHDNTHPGLFSACNAYYGTLEAQGHGTLHCYMLVWVHGSLPPQKLRDRILANENFKDTIFVWLESIIKCELPGMI